MDLEGKAFVRKNLIGPRGGKHLGDPEGERFNWMKAFGEERFN